MKRLRRKILLQLTSREEKMEFVIAGVLLVVAVGIIGCILGELKNAEERKYYDAAARILKENSLDKIISGHGKKYTERKKMMVYLKILGQSGQGYVFEMEKGVRIGRSVEENDLCIRDSHISGRHCGIYLYGGRPAVKEFQSSNGTRLKRGFRKYEVYGTQWLYSGDVLFVGRSRIKMTFFLFDMTEL